MKLIVVFIILICLIAFVKSDRCTRCLGEGDLCYEKIMNPIDNSTYYQKSGQCSGGTQCGPVSLTDENKFNQDTFVCRKLIKEGEMCLSELKEITNNDLCGLALVCENDVCSNSRYASVGEACTSNSSCSSSIATCNNGICTTTHCIQSDDCQFGYYCEYDYNVCKPVLSEGQICERYEQCPKNLYCNSNDTCAQPYKSNLGEPCKLDQDCNIFIGLYCPRNINNELRVCEKFIEPIQVGNNCSETDDSCGDYQGCSCTDGKCYPYSGGPLETAIMEDVYICLFKNNCSQEVQNIPSQYSCISKHCKKEFCEYGNKSPSSQTPLLCDQNHVILNEYCKEEDSSNSSSNSVSESDSSLNSSNSKFDFSILLIVLITFINCIIYDHLKI